MQKNTVLFSVIMPLARGSMLSDTYFGVKIDFCGGRKIWEPGEKPSRVRLRLTNHIQAKDWTQVAVVGGPNDDQTWLP